MYLPFGIIVALATLIVDQYTKYWCMHVYGLTEGSSVAVLPFFNLVAVWNPGVSFGMFRDLGIDNSMVLIGFAVGLTTTLLVWLSRTDNRFLARALGLVIGGAIGNIIDRARFGAVFDFLDFHLMDWHWPAFNIADSAICIGVCLILLDSFLCTSKQKKY